MLELILLYVAWVTFMALAVGKATGIKDRRFRYVRKSSDID